MALDHYTFRSNRFPSCNLSIPSLKRPIAPLHHSIQEQQRQVHATRRNMLHCKPSEISISISDLNRLDQRLAARQVAGMAQQQRPQLSSQPTPQKNTRIYGPSHARTSYSRHMAPGLRPSPGQTTKRAMVEVDPEVHSPSSASTSSGDTVLTADDEAQEDLPVVFVPSLEDSNIWTLDTITDMGNGQLGHRASRSQAAGGTEGATAEVHQSRPELSSRIARSEGNEYHTTHENDRLARPASPCIQLNLGGALNHEVPAMSASIRDSADFSLPAISPMMESSISPGRPAKAVDEDLLISQDGRPILVPLLDVSPGRGIPPSRDKSKITRARANSLRDAAELHIHEDLADQQSFIEECHRRWAARSTTEPVPSEPLVPEAALRNRYAQAQSGQNESSLNASAPVFMPRVRFGSSARNSTTRVSPDALVADSSGTSNRVRPGSDNNRREALRHVEHEDMLRDRHIRLAQAAVNLADAQQMLPPNLAEAGHTPITQRASTRRSCRTDETQSDQSSTPNLERYPVLPLPSQRRARAVDSAEYHGTPMRVGLSRVHSPKSTSLRRSRSRDGGREASVSLVGRGSKRLDEKSIAPERLRSPSPSMSVSSRSTPNLLHRPMTGPATAGPRIHSRHSSLSWSRRSSRADADHGIPSIVSAASGISIATVITRLPSTSNDAALEFMRMRNSPLDDLTERVSRLVAVSSAVRDTAERMPSEWSQARQPARFLSGSPFRNVPLPVQHYAYRREPHQEHEPPASTEQSTPQRTVNATNQEDTAVRSPASSSPFPSSPPLAPGTPRGHPAQTSSPRTPLGDISMRKTQHSPPPRSPQTCIRSTPKMPIYHDAEPPHTQPQTPADFRQWNQRRRGLSDTTRPVPSSTAADASNEQSSVEPIPLQHDSLPHSSWRDRILSRAQHARGGYEQENDEERQMRSMEPDRQVWLSRRDDLAPGGGVLDRTPPEEGRFERRLR